MPDPSSLPDEPRPDPSRWERAFLVLALIFLGLSAWGGWRAGIRRGHCMGILFQRDLWILWSGAFVLWMSALVQAFRARQARTFPRRGIRSFTLLVLVATPFLGIWMSAKVRDLGFSRWVSAMDPARLRKDCQTLMESEPSGTRHPIRLEGSPEYGALPHSIRILNPVSVQVLQDNWVDLSFGGSETEGHDGLLVSPYTASGWARIRSIGRVGIAPGVSYYWTRH